MGTCVADHRNLLCGDRRWDLARNASLGILRPGMDSGFAARLTEAGIDPAKIADPHEAWLRLFDRFGRRATLIDRYELEAEVLGISADDLPAERRGQIAPLVLEVSYPGIELVGTSGGDAVEIVPYDAEWPGLFGSLRNELKAVLGDKARRIEHVGSTAVPGLAAKPVIDVQVSVVDVEIEATYVQAIESLRMPLRAREPGHRYFRPPPGEPRAAHIHVCDAGSRWENDHILFRDYLRERPTARDAYADLKRGLARRYHDDRLAYNEAKTSFIFDTLDEAHLWAEAENWSVGSSR